MFPTQLTQPQREGVFDLLLMGMYADDNLRLAENERLYALVQPHGWEGSRDPQEYAQLATARVRAAVETKEAADQYLINISARLATDDVRTLALALLSRLIEADDEATESEADFFQKAKAAFGV